MLQKLGWGHFSTVWLVADAQTGSHAALKVPTPSSCLLCNRYVIPMKWHPPESLAVRRAAKSLSSYGTCECLHAGSVRLSPQLAYCYLSRGPGQQMCQNRQPAPACDPPLQVQKSAGHYTEAARDEIEMLQRIAEGPPARSRHCVRLLDSFDHRGPNGLHVCMVFEVRAVLAASAAAGNSSPTVSLWWQTSLTPLRAALCITNNVMLLDLVGALWLRSEVGKG